MPQNKRHHFVPRFYLRLFSNDGASIRLLNLRSGRLVEAASLDSQCYKNYFYGKELDAERALAAAEGQAAPLLKRLAVGSMTFKRGTAEHISLATYLLIQFGRTTYQADALDEQLNNMAKHLLSRHPDAPAGLEHVRIGHSEPARASLGFALMQYPILLDLKFKLLRIRGEGEFITSDNPVVLYNQLMEFREHGANTGFAVRGLQILLPISPKTLLILYDSQVYGVGDRQKDVIEIRSATDVRQLNLLQVVSAHENIYARGKAVDLAELHRHAAPFLRKTKTKFSTQITEENEERVRELVISSRQDVRTGLSVSVIRLLKPAKAWQHAFRLLDEQPAVVVRDRQAVEMLDKYGKEVIAGTYSGDFFTWLRTKGAPQAPVK